MGDKVHISLHISHFLLYIYKMVKAKTKDEKKSRRKTIDNGDLIRSKNKTAKRKNKSNESEIKKKESVSKALSEKKPGGVKVEDKINPNQVKRAILALQKFVGKKEGKDQLFDDEDTVEFQISIGLFKVPQKKRDKPYQILLPNPIYNPEEVDICLITKDPQREYKNLVESLDLPVAKVIGLTKLRKNYKQYEAKRNLRQSYDIFVSDDRVIEFLPMLLGKTFYTRKSTPIAINLKKKTVLKQKLEGFKSSTFLHLGRGPCTTIRVGKSDMETNQIKQNILKAVEQSVEKIQGGWKNIQSIQLKTPTSMSLPIYSSVPGEVIERIQKK